MIRNIREDLKGTGNNRREDKSKEGEHWKQSRKKRRKLI